MKPKNIKTIIFSDLDGTFLNEQYTCREIEPIIRQLKSLNVSIVFASSKTRWEIDFYRKELTINDPYIVENGSAIIIPENYFQSPYTYAKTNQDNRVIELGMSYSVVRKKLGLVGERTGAKIVGFGDMSVKEIAKDAGLPLRLASLAKKREYDEPFRIIDGDQNKVLNALNAEGLRYTIGGRYFHALGNTDKGKALAILKNLYLQEHQEIVTIGVGDSPNDLPMLQLVDKPFWLSGTENRQMYYAVWQQILREITDLGVH